MATKRKGLRKLITLTLLSFLILTARFFLLAFAEEISYDSANRRDPFIPLMGKGAVVKQEIRQDLHVEGIVIDPKGGSLALINGDFYKQGDTVGKSNVISILKDRVILQENDQQKTLWIRDELLPGGDKDAKKTAVASSVAHPVKTK